MNGTSSVQRVLIPVLMLCIGAGAQAQESRAMTAGELISRIEWPKLDGQPFGPPELIEQMRREPERYTPAIRQMLRWPERLTEFDPALNPEAGRRLAERGSALWLLRDLIGREHAEPILVEHFEAGTALYERWLPLYEAEHEAWVARGGPKAADSVEDRAELIRLGGIRRGITGHMDQMMHTADQLGSGALVVPILKFWGAGYPDRQCGWAEYVVKYGREDPEVMERLAKMLEDPSVDHNVRNGIRFAIEGLKPLPVHPRDCGPEHFPPSYNPATPVSPSGPSPDAPPEEAPGPK